VETFFCKNIAVLSNEQASYGDLRSTLCANHIFKFLAADTAVSGTGE
jgi:hypothetical protein